MSPRAEPPVIVCPCGKRLKAAGAVPGRLGRCPKCGAEFRVPESETERTPDRPTVPKPERTLSSPKPRRKAEPVDGGLPKIGHDPLPDRAPSSYVAARQAAPNATLGAGPVGRGGFLSPTATPESGIGGSLLFPLRDMTGLGWIALMSLALIPFSLAVAGLFNIFRGNDGLFVMGVLGLLALTLALIVGYALGFLHNVAVEAAMGEVVHPRWPEFDAFAILGNFLPWLAGILSGLPLVAPAFYFATTRGDSGWPNRIVLALLIALPLGYVLMAVLTVLLHNEFTAARPWVVAKAILRIGPSYLGVWAFGGFVAFAASLFYWLLSDQNSPGLVILGAAFGWFFVLYAGIVTMRALGLCYFRHSTRIGWFPERKRWGVRS